MAEKDRGPELTIPLFHVDPPVGGKAQEQQAPPKTVVSGKCPRCTRDRKVGMTRASVHLFWRAHTITTHGGVKRECAASNAPLHQHPALRVPGDGEPAVCPCLAIKHIV